MYSKILEIVNNDKKWNTMCPRCGNALNRRNALSRQVDVYICSACGTDEALREYNEAMGKIDSKPYSVNDWYCCK